MSDHHFEQALGEYLEIARTISGRETDDRFLERHSYAKEELTQQISAIALLDGLIAEERRRDLKLNEYRLLYTLGRGGTGTVYLAEHEANGRLVAIKVMESLLTQPRDAIKRFEREAKIALATKHPNLVKVYEYSCSANYAYLAMEFVPGINLSQLVAAMKAAKTGKGQTADPVEVVHNAVRELEQKFGLELDPEEFEVQRPTNYFEFVAELGSEVADALEYLHGHDILHRDVKPQNILLGSDLAPLLTDFGLARPMNPEGAPLTRPENPVGTPDYMSPEMVEHGTGSIDKRSDIYSLGVTLYELVTLERPFTGKTLHDVLHRVRTAFVKPPRSLDASIPRELESIILKAIERNPAARYQSARDLAEDLRRFLRHEPIHARTLGTFGKLMRFLGRHKMACVALTLGLGAVGASYAVLQASRNAEWERLVTEGRALVGKDQFERAAPLLKRAWELRHSAELAPMLRMAEGWFVVPFDVEPRGADVFVTKLDETTGQPQPRQHVGAGPLQAELTPGHYRVLAKKEGVGLAEASFVVTQKVLQPSVRVALRPSATLLENMVAVPAGSYKLGYNPKNPAQATPFALPERAVTTQAFYLDKYEVTNAEYALFVAATARPAPTHWLGGAIPAGAENLPVVFVSWEDASAYAAWVGKRLPTQDEWEVAARGNDFRLYTWGADTPLAQGVFGAPVSKSFEERTYSLRGGPDAAHSATADRSPFQALHMAGNVREWVEDPWVPREGVRPGEYWMHSPGSRTVKGRSWKLPPIPSTVASSFRCCEGIQTVREDLGFRCAVTRSN